MLIIYFDTLHAKLHEYFSTGLIETSLYLCTVNQQYSFIHENFSHEKQLNKNKAFQSNYFIHRNGLSERNQTLHDCNQR